MGAREEAARPEAASAVEASRAVADGAAAHMAMVAAPTEAPTVEWGAVTVVVASRAAALRAAGGRVGTAGVMAGYAAATTAAGGRAMVREAVKGEGTMVAVGVGCKEEALVAEATGVVLVVADGARGWVGAVVP